MARELIILPRFERDYRFARKHPEFEPETLEYVFDVMTVAVEVTGLGRLENRLVEATA